MLSCISSVIIPQGANHAKGRLCPYEDAAAGALFGDSSGVTQNRPLVVTKTGH
jgi:hypothetical protein